MITFEYDTADENTLEEGFYVVLDPDNSNRVIAEWDGTTWKEIGVEWDHWACQDPKPTIYIVGRINLNTLTIEAL